MLNRATSSFHDGKVSVVSATVVSATVAERKREYNSIKNTIIKPTEISYN